MIVAALLCVVAGSASAWPAMVERVVDGDTLRVRVPGREVVVRIAGIDAPEHDQPGGMAAKAALAGLVAGRQVDVAPTGRDRYGRVVAAVSVAERDVGLAMVAQGFAWQFLRYDHGQPLRDAEAEARDARRGLWQDGDPIPPWAWRRAPGQATRVTAEHSVDPACRPAPRCAVMTSCAEAMAALARCGSAGLDGDRDGIPCEKLCQPTG